MTAVLGGRVRATATPRRRSGGFLVGAVTQLATLAGAVAVWEIVTRGLDQVYFPPPSTIVAAMHEAWLSGPAGHLFLNDQATTGLSSSLGRLLFGWACAAVFGVVAGVALGRSPKAAQYLDPVLQLGRAMPAPTLIPLFIVVFHVGASMEIATIIFGVVWPIVLNAMDGARSVDRLQIDMAAVFGVTGVRRLTHVIVPGAAPKIFAGLRTSVSLSLILMVMAELLGSGNGIGAQLVNAQREFEIPRMWGGIVILGILGYVLNALFQAVERWCLGWHRGVRQSGSS
jgi:ABC-type nitrate/sulfonate/bicarbonate transport system permease component